MAVALLDQSSIKQTRWMREKLHNRPVKMDMDDFLTRKWILTSQLRSESWVSEISHCSIFPQLVLYSKQHLMTQRLHVYKCKGMIDPQTLMKTQLKTCHDLDNYSNPVTRVTRKTTPRITDTLNRVIFLDVLTPPRPLP